MTKREPGRPRCRASSLIPSPTPPTLVYTCQSSGLFCLSQLPLLFWAGMASWHSSQASLAGSASPSGYISGVRVTPISLASSLGRHSYLTLLKHWPSSWDTQSNSQRLCFASPSPSHVSGGTSPLLGIPIFPVTVVLDTKLKYGIEHLKKLLSFIHRQIHNLLTLYWYDAEC